MPPTPTPPDIVNATAARAQAEADRQIRIQALDLVVRAAPLFGPLQLTAQQLLTEADGVAHWIKTGGRIEQEKGK
jgi:hypothetical protein